MPACTCLPASALLPPCPRRFLNPAGFGGFSSNSARFFWDGGDRSPRPLRPFKTVEPRSGGELLALRFRTRRNPKARPRRNGGTEVLWHFWGGAVFLHRPGLRGKGPRPFLLRPNSPLSLGAPKFSRIAKGTQGRGGVFERTVVGISARTRIDRSHIAAE